MPSTIDNDDDSVLEYSDTEECDGGDDTDTDSGTLNRQKKCDPEHFEFECLKADQVS